MFKTTDGGNSFQSLIGGYQTTQFYNGFANSATDPDRAIGGLQDNFTAVYDGGNPWRRVIGGDGSWAAINATNDETMYGSYQGLNIQRSFDGFGNWNGVAPPGGSNPTAFIAPFVLSPSDPGVMYAGRNYVYRSTSQGSSWSTTNGNSPLNGNNVVLVMDMSTTDPDKCYAATAPTSPPMQAFLTTNGGGFWGNITNSLPDRYPGDITVDPNDDDIVYITMMGFGTPHVFKSTTSGALWTDISGNLPDVPTSAVMVDPDHPDVVYVGTDLGVYVTADGGAFWQPFMRDMQTSMVNDLKIAPGRVLRAATHGSGVFERPLYDPDMVDVAGGVGAPGPAVALRVHPTPLRGRGTVTFQVDTPGEARVSLFDLNGREVAVLANRAFAVGSHDLPVDVRELASGVFYVRAVTSGESVTTRVVHVR